MTDRTKLALLILTLTNLFIFMMGAMVLCSNSGEPEKYEFVQVNPN